MLALMRRGACGGLVQASHTHSKHGMSVIRVQLHGALDMSPVYAALAPLSPLCYCFRCIGHDSAALAPARCSLGKIGQMTSCDTYLSGLPIALVA